MIYMQAHAAWLVDAKLSYLPEVRMRNGAFPLAGGL